MLHRRGFILGGVTVLLGSVPCITVTAAKLPQPAARVLLSVTGAIEHTNARGLAEFDRVMLEQLGIDRLVTWTPWTKGETVFDGVLARRLMEAVGARGSEVLAEALNDFRSVIPIADFDRYDVLLAMTMNGERLRVRNKGPIWIVYPWSGHPELDDFATREKSVWQLRTLQVR